MSIGDAAARVNSQGNIPSAGSIVKQRTATNGGVAISVAIGKCKIPDGCVEDTGGVASERRIAIGRVRPSSTIAAERKITGGGVTTAFGVARKRGPSIGRVEVAGAVDVQRRKTNGGVLGAGSVIKKCNSPDRRILVGGRILREARKRPRLCWRCRSYFP